MEGQGRRHRSSTAASRSSLSSSPTALELRGLLDELSQASSLSAATTVDCLQSQCDTLQRIRQLLIDAAQPVQIKDVFRQLGGFGILLGSFRSISGYYDTSKLRPDQISAFFELLKSSLDVLSEVLNEHSGNRRFFSKRVEGGGWKAIEQALCSTGIGANISSSAHAYVGLDVFFGCLFGFLLGEDDTTRLFRDFVKPHIPKDGVDAKKIENNIMFQSGEDANHESRNSMAANSISTVVEVRDRQKSILSGREIVQNSNIAPIILNFWSMTLCPDASNQDTHPLSYAIIFTLREIIDISEYNKASIHSTEILSSILRCLFGRELPIKLKFAIRELAESLSKFGINGLQDAYFLYEHSTNSEEVADFLHASMKNSRDPAFIQFDLSLNGYSSVELRDLGHSFPPFSPSAGYSIATWIRVDRYDSGSHTTLFGACDASQTCFVLFYLEKETRNFILQTSVTSSKPSVRFRSSILEEGTWYHVALIHRRPRTTSSSRAALYINGEFVEQIKCPYPAVPPILTTSEENAAPTASGQKHASVQAFLGTPQDLASKIGRNISFAKLSMASFHLFQDALSDELVAVYQKVGPRYSGNYQDALGSFQTYRASAFLNIYNETLHPGKEEKSEIVAAVRSKAGAVLSESRILLSISPLSVLDDDDRNNVDESQLIRSLSREAAKNLQQYVRVGGNSIVINSAIPSVNEALTQKHGVALLLGSPVVVVPQALDDASWRVAGCGAVGVRLVEQAQSQDSLLRAVCIFFESVEDNWRNSEAMEKDHGFAVLAGLLREKLGYGFPISNSVSRQTFHVFEGIERDTLSFELLRIILKFIGYDETDISESVIINPLAYRTLLVDFDLWRKSCVKTQTLYFKQFVHFAQDSKHHLFNQKRLARTRIIKRLLDAYKGESLPVAVSPGFKEAFSALLKGSMTGENQRVLALFVTYALHDERVQSNRGIQRRQSTMRLKSRPTPPSNSPHGSTPRSGSPYRDISQLPVLSRSEIGVSVLEIFVNILCDHTNTGDIKRFARMVTNKWLLYLVAEDEPRVVVAALKILSRLLVSHDSGYGKKFSDKTGGFLILRKRLKEWWNVPSIWILCFAMLFGCDVAKVNLSMEFTVPNLLAAFSPMENLKVVYREIVSSMTGMLESGLRALSRDLTPADKAAEGTLDEVRSTGNDSLKPIYHGRQRSVSLLADLAKQVNVKQYKTELRDQYSMTLSTAIKFLTALHLNSSKFREFSGSSSLVQDLLFVLYPVIVTSDSVSADTELQSRGSILSFEGKDVVIQGRPDRGTEHSIVRTSSVEAPHGPQNQRTLPLRRGSSFILVTKGRRMSASGQLNRIMSPEQSGDAAFHAGNVVVELLVDFVIGIFLDQLLDRKDFSGFGLFLKVPPGFQEHQAYFESYILLHAMNAISGKLKEDQNILCEPRILTNLSRYTMHMAEAVFEGWFLHGAEPLLDFIGLLLEYLQRPDIARAKSVRLCAQAIATIRTVFLRVILLRLSELDGQNNDDDLVHFLHKLIFWHTVILSPDNTEVTYLRLICYHLYAKLGSTDIRIKAAAVNFWRIFLVQKPVESTAVLTLGSSAERQPPDGFLRLTELDNESFIDWVDSHRSELDSFFYGSMSKWWEDFVHNENRKTEETAKNRLSKRKDKLKQWQAEEHSQDDFWHRHEVSTTHWRANIHASERLKHQRTLQDMQDGISFLTWQIQRLERTLLEPCGLVRLDGEKKWQLDETEGRNRMRMRILPDFKPPQDEYKPKRTESVAEAKSRLKIDAGTANMTAIDVLVATPLHPNKQFLDDASSHHDQSADQSEESDAEDDFEVVDDPYEGENGFEDKNRKVMRSLEHGDQVQHVCNIARIVGLEACEGLLIVGNHNLYLLDHFFQRSDGEIVRVWQAPSEERDPYLQMITGRHTTTSRPPTLDGEEATKHWRWAEVISMSKRRFLFRDVATEIFFADGRSYLLISISTYTRNDLYNRIISRAPHVHSSSPSQSEDAWRIDSLRNPDEVPQTLGSKFANVFASSSWLPMTKKWLKGEISNFNYLMFVNTLAGRTFNDLTQYPVFPWVIADYTSDTLDLTDPRTFRDLSKPMGCQTASREAEFRERYQSFAEMGDQNAPPFHYGTHYSSAMIVTSYLIRLQPFVQSYLLLQGGSFDHADRMFYSIEKAWLSASRDNMTDVRELTPEFFYLPEFLINTNSYNFGSRQGTGQKIDNVVLPPWAKGDPRVFISKHREALESPHVSKNLHKWIDLVFGFKQRGEAAIEGTNVFHYLSYQGAKNLDNIVDPVERLATIGIIHNFGQTPHQVFQRAHAQREDALSSPRRLDGAAESLTRLPSFLLESHERVASLLYSSKQDRLLCSAAFRVNMPPHYDRYMEWGFTDGSVRFYSADTKRILGLFERLHIGQVSAAVFASSRVLLTGGTDCTVSLWNVASLPKTIDFSPRVTLFGHRAPVTVIAASRVFSSFLSADSTGRVFLWDLNRCEFVRELILRPANHSGRNRGRPSAIPLGAVTCARISNVTGRILLCAGAAAFVFSLNGDLLVEQEVCETREPDDTVQTCTFYEGVSDEWIERELIFTGHRRGVASIWHLRPDPPSSPAELRAHRAGNWTLSPVKRLNHTDPGRDDGGNLPAAITCVLPMAHSVYTGDEDGRVFEWDCVQKQGV